MDAVIPICVMNRYCCNLPQLKTWTGTGGRDKFTYQPNIQESVTYFTIYGDINLNNFLSGRTNMWLVRVRWNNLTRQKHGMIWNEMEQRSTQIGSKSPIEYCTIHTNDVINWKIMRDRYIIPPHNLRGTTIGICCGTRRMSICII